MKSGVLSDFYFGNIIQTDRQMVKGSEAAKAIAALQDMEVGAERTSAATDLLGRSATDMATVLNMTAEEAEALKQEARDCGMVMGNEAVSIISALAEGIIGAIPTLMPVVLQVVTELVGVLVTLLSQIADAGMQIIVSLIQGIAQAIPTLIPQIVLVVTQIVQTLIENLP